MGVFITITLIFITITPEVQHKVIITHHASTQLELKDH